MLFDDGSIDWAPSLDLGYECAPVSKGSAERHRRAEERSRRICEQHTQAGTADRPMLIPETLEQAAREVEAPLETSDATCRDS